MKQTTFRLDLRDKLGALKVRCGIGFENKKARIIDKDGCMECGACVLNCEDEAIEVTPGVGCATYIINTWIRGKEKATCP